MPIEPNDLETARFGITCARVTDAADLAAVNAAARAQGVAFLSLRVPASDLDSVHRLEADGYRLMDTLVYYARALTPPLPAPPRIPDLHLRAAGPEDAPDLGRIAAAGFAGYIGHYHADPRLDPAAADAVYVDWAETSARRATPDAPVFLAWLGATPCGFLTLRRNSPDEDEIVLNAVHPDYQRGGIYTALVTHALHASADRGASRLTVSTQIHNYGVQRVWSRLGLSHCASFHTFHKWLSDPTGPASEQDPR